MRPVLLDMDGFAAFREPTRVDFRDADYFVLVGPTGSGKSTVLDAISFALYGTVPRWEDRRKVALALAPTAVRGTVRLVFDVGGIRYQVARELRRSGGATRQVSIKNARLERLADPAGIGDVDEATEQLAADGAVNDAVVKLLGLSFDHFCKCVSLPQGAFAEFLHAQPSVRDDILSDLLGLGMYEIIARRAREEATSHRARVTALTDQLTGYADDTEDAEQAAATRVDALTVLAGTVDRAVPQLRQLTDAAGVQTQQVGQLTASARQLTAVTAPDGLADLAARVTGEQAHTNTAATELAAADTTDRAAHAARQGAPERAPLEQIARHHRDLSEARTAEPGLAAAFDAAMTAAGEAAGITRAANAAETLARTALDEAGQRSRDADALVERLDGELNALEDVTPPAGIPDLTAAAAAASEEHIAASTALTVAENDEEHARAAANTATATRSNLQRAATAYTGITELETGGVDLDRRQQAAVAAAGSAADELEQAGAHLEHTQRDFDLVARTDLAALLRPQLIAGDACPVCAQQVETLPPPLPAEDLTRAKDSLDAAKARLRAAETASAAADRAVDRLDDEQQTLAAKLSELRRQLTGAPDSLQAVTAALAAIDQLTTAETDATLARKAARSRLGDAEIALAQKTAAQQAASRLFTAAREPLVALALDPPAADQDVTDSWAQLHTWANAQADDRRAKQTGARKAAGQETAALDIAASTFTATQSAAGQAHQAEIAANAAAATTKAQHEQVTGQISRLTVLLDGKPNEAATSALLADLDALDEACRLSAERVRDARSELERCQQQLSDLDEEVTAGWRQLRAARDPLVPYGAPELSGTDLQAAWTQLCDWATGQAAVHADQAAAAQTALTDLEERRDTAADALTAELTAVGIALRADAELADAAPVAVAKAAAEAAAVLNRITERRAQAADLHQRRADAERDQQVAGHLGQLMRTDNFPRWLASSALNTLLMEASASLLELSGGQFELTHDGAGGGDLLIVDHADADSRRPVKTLSGGETFQASLALALALSSQMAALAEAGAARLDSIFLDEGFGTLDETTLDIVADTLETLAGQKERMVGVITHVPALAERIPVKFAVARDQASSRVTRNDA
jgi:exonuclease SbcC